MSDTHKIVILGAGGQIGQALLQLLAGNACGLTRSDADFEAPEQLLQVLAEHKPTALINAAAYTQVDRAEQESERAMHINATVPGMLAEFCREAGIPLIHYSTDYVFSGEGVDPWTEEDTPAPLNVYGESKLAGEQAIQGVGGEYLILRTSWVYDAYHAHNFVRTMLRLGDEREEIRVVDDQTGAPGFAPHIALATMEALARARVKESFPSGVYHMAARGEVSWYEFALRIFTLARLQEYVPDKMHHLHAIKTCDYPTPARRPLNSRLRCRKLRQVLGVSLPDWEEGLATCITQIRELYAQQ